MATDSIRKQIIDNLITTLKTIAAGSSYNYTPDEVIGADPPILKLLQDQVQSGIATMYFVVAGTGSHEHWTSGKRNQDEFEVFIFGSRIYETQYADEFEKIDQGEAQKYEIREQMIRDVTRVLLVDLNRGNLAQNTNITDVRPIPDIKEVAERAMFEMRLTIPYVYGWATP